MTFDPTKPVRTSSGLPVTILHTNLRGPYPILGVIHFEDHDAPETWTRDGLRYMDSTSNIDLVNVPAAFDPKLPVQTRAGHAVTILVSDLNHAAGYTIAARVRFKDGTDIVTYHHPNGQIGFSDDNHHDLVNVNTSVWDGPDVPPWAEFHAYDRNGIAFWYAKRPSKPGWSTWTPCTTLWERHSGAPTSTVPWDQSLTERPKP